MDHFLEPDPAPRLSRGYVDRATAVAWLAWKDAAGERRDAFRFWFLAALSIVAALASIVAAVEGWHWWLDLTTGTRVLISVVAGW